MKVICLCCGHTLDLHESYDDYEGKIRCFVCGSLLAIHTEEGQVRSVEMASDRGSLDESSLEKVN